MSAPAQNRRFVSRFSPRVGNVETGGNENGNEGVSPSETVETAPAKQWKREGLKSTLSVSICCRPSP